MKIKMMSSVPKQIHILVVQVMLLLTAYRIAWIILANSSPVC